MSGPIIRSGASPEFSKNWENIFGKKKPAEKKTPAAAGPKKKPGKKKKK
jgi:hypothetical protein